MRTVVSILFACVASWLLGQHPARYDSLINEAHARYELKEYPASAKLYSDAFEALGWKGTLDDRYDAACLWALSGVPDSAFFQLFRIAELMDFHNLDHMTKDSDLASLHADPRWDQVVVIVSENKEKAEVNFDKPLVHTLDSIFDEDQAPRRQVQEVGAQYGRDSEEMMALWSRMGRIDSANLLVVTKILDERGWLGADIIGGKGNATLFLVIQHADLSTQERYLPMMRAAVANGDAEGSSLALLEDRVALGEGKWQIYGSQIGRDNDTGEFYVLPLEDPDHVDERRAQVGLGPLAEYAGRWDLKWDPVKYKEQLPALEAKQREQQK